MKNVNYIANNVRKKRMMDKEWLDRVNLASQHFEAMTEANKEAVGNFVNWLYALYGITPPEKRGDKK